MVSICLLLRVLFIRCYYCVLLTGYVAFEFELGHIVCFHAMRWLMSFSLKLIVLDKFVLCLVSELF